MVADYNANIPDNSSEYPTINGVASLTLTVDILPTTGDSSDMIKEIEGKEGVMYLKYWPGNEGAERKGKIRDDTGSSVRIWYSRKRSCGGYQHQ